MDAAISAAVAKASADTEARTIARMQAVAEAQRVVRPYVGEVSGMDSAEGIYGFALKQIGVETKGIHPSAWRSLLEMAPKPGAAHSPAPFAMDAAAGQSLASLCPSVSRVILG